jgi:hypothetical protein
MDRPIKDRMGHILCYIDEGINNTFIKDSRHAVLATYGRLNDETRDSQGHLIGKGDLTGRFIPIG